MRRANVVHARRTRTPRRRQRRTRRRQRRRGERQSRRTATRMTTSWRSAIECQRDRAIGGRGEG
eukprot:5916396-Prymnesium_polylepis.1